MHLNNILSRKIKTRDFVAGHQNVWLPLTIVDTKSQKQTPKTKQESVDWKDFKILHHSEHFVPNEKLMLTLNALNVSLMVSVIST